MTVYKRTWQEFTKGILYTLTAGVLGLMVGSLLTSLAGAPGWAGAVLAVLFIVAIGLLLVAGEHIRLELCADGTLRMFRMGRLRHTLSLAVCGLEKARQRGSYAHNFILIITPAPQAGGAAPQKRIRLDCTPLGKAQFERLCDEILSIRGGAL